jgi:two-component system cell cycle response regulator DivK
VRSVILKKTILLVEDSKIQKLATARILIKAGFLVLSAEDGEEALRLAHEAVPDLILLDMLLPKLGGMEVLLALKTDRVTARIPVIILSTLPRTNEEKLKSEGAAAYFEKSHLNGDAAGERDLVETIEEVLRESSQQNVAATQAKSAANRG